MPSLCCVQFGVGLRQTLPQAPQLLGSLVVSTHCSEPLPSLHMVREGVEHTHFAEAHTRLLSQA